MTTPKLRFKEFDGCWVEKIISEIADVRGGKRLPKGYSLQEENNGFPYITVTDMENGTVNLEKIRYVPLEAIDQIKRYRISVDEIYISVAGTLGLVGIIPQELNNANLTENADKLTNIKCNQFYLLHYLNNGSLSKLIDSVSTIGAQPKLALYAIQGMPIFLPSLDEQTKIASFLSAVDEKISQLTQKHELLSQYKQGMMQKLFSQQIRFKADDGSEFGEWENKTLSKFIIKHIGGASLKPSDFVEQSEYEVIPKKAIVPNGYLNLDKDNPTYCSEDFFKANLKNTVDNTYLVTVLRDLVPSGPSIGYIVKYMENTQYILAQGVYGFKLKEELNKDFLIHFSNTKAYRLVMQSIMVGSTQVHIRNQDFFGIEIPVPCLAEQTKIANFLSAIDQKIEVVAQQIEQAKTWKKGLLQQMFV